MEGVVSGSAGPYTALHFPFHCRHSSLHVCHAGSSPGERYCITSWLTEVVFFWDQSHATGPVIDSVLIINIHSL